MQSLLPYGNAPSRARVRVARSVMFTLFGTADRLGLLEAATSVFSADGRHVAIVLSVMERTHKERFSKRTQEGRIGAFEASSILAHHELVFFDCEAESFTGPLSLDNAPSLARVTVAADMSTLYVWSMAEPRSQRRNKGQPSNLKPALKAYPMGSATPRFEVTTPGSWPLGHPDRPRAASVRLPAPVRSPRPLWRPCGTPRRRWPRFLHDWTRGV